MIKVSVCCITYNHEQYIADAIKSVLAQKFEGIIEMIIGEDCSTDSTRSVALSYQEMYPKQIKVITPAKNRGVMLNFMETLAACDGDYIAIIDGDDYWTDPDKLRLQIAALQARPDCAFCFHDADTFVDGESAVEWTFSKRFSHILPAEGEKPKTYTQLDIARWGWFIPTASMLFRPSSLPNPLPDWFEGVYSGDFTLQLLSTRNGPAIYLPRVMSHYRLHPQSVTRITTLTPYQFIRYIHEGKMFQQHVFEPKHRKYADIYLAQKYENYAEYLGSEGQRIKQLNYSTKALVLRLQHISMYLERRISTFRNKFRSLKSNK
jgi:glycosyltransferase involved in cell wall biosynthesis